MTWQYKSEITKFNNRWTNTYVDTEQLDTEINLQAKQGWELVDVSITSLFGYPQSALCVYKREVN